VPFDGRGRITIEWRADGVGKLGEIDRFGMKYAVAIGEMMHGKCLEHELDGGNQFSSLRAKRSNPASHAGVSGLLRRSRSSQ
jgi:hypothetical protein